MYYIYFKWKHYIINLARPWFIKTERSEHSEEVSYNREITISIVRMYFQLHMFDFDQLTSIKILKVNPPHSK